MKLYVGNLPFSSTQKDLEDLFSAFTSLVSAKLITDQEGRSKGYGFVELGSEDEAREAISALNQKQIGTRAIIVNEARPQEPRKGGRGDGRRGDSRSFNNNRGFR